MVDVAAEDVRLVRERRGDLSGHGGGGGVEGRGELLGQLGAESGLGGLEVN